MSELLRYRINWNMQETYISGDGYWCISANALELIDAERLRADTAVAEVAALREEVAGLAELKAYITIPLRDRCAERKDLQQRLTAAEQRNSELIGVLEMFADNSDDGDVVEISRHHIALAKPTESAHEACTSCDGSGEYVDAIGDWRGYCSCPAGVALKNKPTESGASE